MYDSGLAKRPPGSVLSAAPHDRQNFLPGVTGVPQLGQAASSRAPQSSQKRAPASFSTWHRGHLMPESPKRSGRSRSERCAESSATHAARAAGLNPPPASPRASRPGPPQATGPPGTRLGASSTASRNSSPGWPSTAIAGEIHRRPPRAEDGNVRSSSSVVLAEHLSSSTRLSSTNS